MTALSLCNSISPALWQTKEGAGRGWVLLRDVVFMHARVCMSFVSHSPSNASKQGIREDLGSSLLEERQHGLKLVSDSVLNNHAPNISVRSP